MVTPKKIIMKDLELADKEIARLRKENKELERENKSLLYEIKCWYENRKERDKRMLELEKENEELKKKLEHYENTEAIQKANANSIIYWTYTISKI